VNARIFPELGVDRLCHRLPATAAAEARNIAPDDGLEKAAPAILKTTFQYREWTKSPEAMLFSRRERNYEHIYSATEEHP